MLHKDMIVIIRNDDERKCFCDAANKLGLCGSAGTSPEKLSSHREQIVMYIEECQGACLLWGEVEHIDNDKRPFVIEASDLFRNKVIAMRRAQDG